MCGIVGVITKKENPTLDLVKSFNDQIIHRGPDAEGFYIYKNVAFGHRRLSIIDLNSGDQPMLNLDETITIVFNGEIYNYKELKKQLRKKITISLLILILTPKL